MSFTKKLSLGTAAIALLAAAPAAVYAQETTGGVRGTVSADGAPVSGASVVVTHVPSGSVSRVTTSANGGFNARDLRVGGPYTVRVDAAGYGSQMVEDVYLALGAPANLPIVLNSGAADVIVVTASASMFTDIETGPAARFTADDINGLPSISRDPRDVARLSTFANLDPENSDAISLAGSNNRYNSFTVDGVAQNDLFGLNSSGFPSENRGPVSIDALAALSVEIAPFDVQYGGFTGGTINAVTRSGDNDFHGSLYYFRTDDSLIGDSSRGRAINFSEFAEETRGGWLSGPIIEDRLFFFVSYEEFERTQPLNEGPIGSGALNEISGITQADIDEIINIGNTVYGLNLTSFDDASLGSLDEKLLISIDWNINEDHRAKLTYNTNDGGSVQERRDSANLGTPSTWYNRSEATETLSLQVFSDWSANFSTELTISQSTQDTGQDSLDGADFAQMDISLASGRTVSVGPDFFRHANALANETFQFKLRGEYIYDNHVISGGYERRTQEVFNLFVPGSEGSYDFASINDFRNQVADDLFYQNAVTNDENDGAAQFEFTLDTLYLQDEVSLSDRLTVAFGVRYDRYSTDDAPTANASFLGRYGYSNAATIDGLDVIMPRASFNYEAPFTYDASFADFSVTGVTLRGGVGRFSGGNPLVWISNTYSNNGVSIDSVFVPGPITNVDPYNIPAGAQGALTAGDGSVNAIAPGFDIPSTLRASLGADVMFDMFDSNDWMFTVEYLHDEQANAPFWFDANCPAAGTSPVDGRPIYNCNTDRQDIVLTSVDMGQSDIWSFELEKDFDNAISFWFGYTNQNVEDAHSGTSSTASSNYSDYASFDRQNARASTSNYEIQHDFKLRLGWSHAFYEDYETRVEMFVNHRSGRHFSYTYDYSNGDANQYRNQSPFGIHESAADDEGTLLYVPMTDGTGNVTLTSDPLINYTAGFDITGFNEYLQRTGLINYAGEIAPRNGFDSPWSTRVDMRFQQEIPAFFPAAARGVFYMDIENFGNLLNDNWGRFEQVGYEYFQPVVEIDNIDPVSGAYLYDDFRGDAASETRVSTSSVWQVQFGVRYQF